MKPLVTIGFPSQKKIIGKAFPNHGVISIHLYTYHLQDRHISQIPLCKSDKYATSHHIVPEMGTYSDHVHISVTQWCIVGYGVCALWDLCHSLIRHMVSRFVVFARFVSDIEATLENMVMISYRQVSNIRRTKSQHFKDSRTVLQLSLPNPLKPDVKSRMKM